MESLLGPARLTLNGMLRQFLSAIKVKIDLVTVFEAILTGRQTCEKLQCLYENLMSNNFHETAVLNKYDL